MNANEVAVTKASGKFQPDRKDDWRLSCKAYIYKDNNNFYMQDLKHVRNLLNRNLCSQKRE